MEHGKHNLFAHVQNHNILTVLPCRYWNSYPGARTDSESWSYILNFSKELNAEWIWTERFPAQPEVFRYLSHVADRFDMRKDIQFRTKVSSATYDESKGVWTITTAAGERYTCTFFIAATGPLSVGRDPPFPGLNSFRGDWYQTSNFGKNRVDFVGKRVAVVGTGATGVQVIPVVAHSASSVHVFQRTPNYVLPGRNHALVESQLQEIKRNYEDVWKQARGQVFGFAMPTIGRTMADVKDDAQHQKILESGWEAGGFRYIFGTFDDLLTNQKSNDVASDFIRRKIRAVVQDEKTAELLCPDYPLLAKRPPLGHFYYEAFNRPNVHLVDVSTNAIQEITPTGLRTDTDEYEFDIIIFAIGFDAVTGALTNIDIRGRDNRSLRETWEKRLETYLGIGVEGFPNLFMITGPQAPFANIPVIVDNTVDWIGRAITQMRKKHASTIEAKVEAMDRWCEHVRASFEATLLATASKKARSWYIGANVPGKQENVLFYFGGLVAYFEQCEREAVEGFPGFDFH